MEVILGILDLYDPAAVRAGNGSALDARIVKTNAVDLGIDLGDTRALELARRPEIILQPRGSES